MKKMIRKLYSVVIFICCLNKIYSVPLYPPEIITAGATYGSYEFKILQHLSGISPYFESNKNELNPDAPRSCQIDKAIYLIRHGSVFVDDYDFYHVINPFVKRLNKSPKRLAFVHSSDLAFLTTWTSPIVNNKNQIEKLTNSGIFEAYQLGTRLSYRYPKLVPKKNISSFKVWASSSDRTKQSASALLAGLFGGKGISGKRMIIPEEKTRGGNSLTPTKSCARFKSSTGSKQAQTWLKHYSKPIIARFNAKTRNFRFSVDDIFAMQQLCGYETVIRGSSSFCKLFTAEEWLAFEYYFDIKYHYELGYGSSLSPILGMPWLVASTRLFNQSMQTNQNLYLSVAHREMLPIILTALNLYNDSMEMNTEQINDRRTWKSSEIIPFMGHIALERMHCNSHGHRGSFVRVIVNSKPKPLPGCAGGPGFSCPLSQYMNYIDHRHRLYHNFLDACEIHEKNITEKLSFYENEGH